MSTVNALRLSKDSGAIISDEETWLFGRRRLFISDSIASLISPEMAESLKMEVVFAGIGNISLTFEVIRNIRYVLENEFQHCQGPHEFAYRTVDAVAALCNKEFQKSIKRRVNDILKFRYGFNLKNFTERAFDSGSQRIEIKQKAVIDDCLALIEPGQICESLQPLYENEGLIAGYDKRNGFQIYEIDAVSQEKFLAPSAFCNLGRGADTGSIILADLVNSKTLHERRQGFDKIEGLIELIYSANVTSTFNNQVGGYNTIVIIDGSATSPEKTFTEITDHEARLAGEIVTAYKADLLDKTKTYELIAELVEKKRTCPEIERTMFASVKSARYLDLVLRGYKTQSIDAAYLQSNKEYPAFADGRRHGKTSKKKRGES